MNSFVRFFLEPSPGPASGIVLTGIEAGLIFSSPGILKFIDPAMGALRFTRFALTHPSFTAHFLGTFEILSGVLVLRGLATRVATIPPPSVISLAIVTTRIPALLRSTQGFWTMMCDARTDFAVPGTLMFLLAAGGGRSAIEAWFARQPRRVAR